MDDFWLLASITSLYIEKDERGRVLKEEGANGRERERERKER